MAQIITGARGIVRFTGSANPVGFVSGVNVTVEDTITDVDILGQLEVGDLAETAHKANFSINHFQAINGTNSAATLGLDTSFKAHTDKTSIAPQTNVNSMRSQTAFQIDLVQEDTDVIFCSLVGCKYEGGTGQMDARGLWQGTWNFKATKAFMS